MNDFAIKNYQSKKLSKTVRGFLVTMMFILGGLTIVVADHVGHNLQIQRISEQ